MNFEDVLEDVGSWGRFQKCLIGFYGLSVSMAASIPGMVLLFMVMAPDHSCYLPDVSNVTKKELFQTSEVDTSCRIVTNGSAEACIYGYQYDKTYFDDTAATKWNMVCENSHYPSLVLTLQNVGSLIGGTVYGALADRFGRKFLCFGLLLLSTVTDFASVFAHSFLLFCILRTINGSILPTAYNLPYILISEFVSPERRVLVNVVFNTGWMTGMCILPLAAYLSRSWLVLGIFSSICTASVLLYWKYVPESASWLISQDRYSDAAAVMMLIGKRNGKTIEEKSLSVKLKELCKKSKEEKMKEDKSFFSFMLNYPRLRKHFLILTFSWMANSMAYLGFQYNVIHLAGNVFVNYFLLSLVEAPGNALFWFSLEKMGRRWSAAFGFFTIALCSLLPLSGFEYSDVVSSIIGKLISSGLFMNVDQQGCELFPTVARSLGVGTGKSISMIVVLFTPFVAYLSIYGKMIPFLIIGSVCLIASILSSFLPETLHENLPQTYLDAENFGMDHKYFSFNRRKKPVPETSIYTIEVKDPNILYCIRL